MIWHHDQISEGSIFRHTLGKFAVCKLVQTLRTNRYCKAGACHCDSRISPLAAVGMQAGDAKILRNAGARVTDDVLRTLVLASYLLGVNRVLVMPHTDCRMANEDEATIHESIHHQFGVDTRSLEFRTVSDQRAALELDVTRIRSYPLLQKGVSVAGAIYDVSTGQLEPVDC